MIGIVTTSYPRWPGDPAGNFVDGHARALLAFGHRVEVIAAGDATTPDTLVTRIPSHLFYRGGAPDLLERAPLRNALAAASFTLRLAAAVRRRRWDAMIAHWLAPSAIACLPTRAPLLAIAHGGDVHTLRRARLLAPVLHALRARDAKLVFVAEQLRELACAAAPSLDGWLRDAIVQPMGVDLARFAAIGRAPAEPPQIVIAARLVPIKGVDVAIDAVSRLDTPARLVIAGDGPERAALAARAPANVTFLGEIDARARDRLLRHASVVVVPSRVLANGRTEGTPAIALEALAAGVPVIASAVGGLSNLPAQLVPPDDPDALARAIAAALRGERRLPPAPDDWSTVARRLLAHSKVSNRRRRAA